MIAAVPGLSTGLLSSPTRSAEPVVPGLWRTGLGPETGYSHPTFGCAQRPEKSGMAWAGACANAGNATMDEIAATDRCHLMSTLSSHNDPDGNAPPVTRQWFNLNQR